MGVGIEKQTVNSGEEGAKQGLSQFASDAHMIIPYNQTSFRQQTFNNLLMYQHPTLGTASIQDSQNQFKKKSTGGLGESSPGSDSHLQSMKAFQNLRHSRFAEHPGIADDLYDHLNRMIISDSNRNFMEEETKPEYYNPNIPPAISMTEARKRSPILTKGTIKSVYVEEHRFGQIPEKDIFEEITTPGTFSNLGVKKRMHSSLITQEGPVPLTETKISQALKKMQSSKRAFFKENLGIDSLKSPKNFIIGGNDPDFDSFKPFCTVIDKREVMQKRQRKATYQQIDTKIAINAQGLKHDLDTFHKTIRIKPQQKTPPKNMISMMSRRRKANSVLRGNASTVNNSIMSPLLSPNASLQKNINSVLFQNVYNNGQNLKNKAKNETLHTIHTDGLSSTKTNIPNDPSPINNLTNEDFNPNNKSNSGQFNQINQQSTSIPSTNLYEHQEGINYLQDQASRNNMNLLGFDANKEVSMNTDLSQLQKAGQKSTDKFNQIQSFDAQEGTHQMTLINGGTKSPGFSDMALVNTKTNSSKKIHKLISDHSLDRDHQVMPPKLGKIIGEAIKEVSETRVLDGESTFQNTQQNMFARGNEVLGPGGVDLANKMGKWSQPVSPNSQPQIQFDDHESGRNVKVFQKNYDDIHMSFKQLLSPKYEKRSSVQSSNFFNDESTKFIGQFASEDSKNLKNILNGLSPQQVHHLQLLTETSNILGSSYAKTQHLKAILNTTLRKKDNTSGVLLEPKMFEKYKSLRNGANEVYLNQDKQNEQNLFWSMGKRSQRNKSTIQSTNRLEINSFENQLNRLKEDMEVGGRYQRQMEIAFGGQSTRYNRAKSLLR